MSNLKKHGVDFERAQLLWADPDLIVLPSKYSGERRFLAIGCIERVFWTAVFTERSDIVRLISVRRSRIEERRLYERNK